MKKVAILQSNYIPWKGYFDIINAVDVFVLYDDMQYTKRDWRNRNKILTSSGSKWLTIPVMVKGKFFQKINETMISESSWAKKHWGSISHNYSKAKYFKDYKSVFEPLYLGMEEKNLSKVNYLLIKTICDLLDIKTKLVWSSDFELAEDRTERLLNICKDLGANEYVSGPAAKVYMNAELFEKEKIKITWFDYSNYPEYKQLHIPFDHYVSILDLVFNKGPEIKKYMKTFGELL